MAKAEAEGAREVTAELGTIAASESLFFRRARIAWALLAVAAILLALLSANFAWLKYVLFAVVGAYFLVGAMVILWQCPRCKKLYSLRFGIVSVCWPYTNRCLQCDSRLEK